MNLEEKKRSNSLKEHGAGEMGLPVAEFEAILLYRGEINPKNEVLYCG